MILLNEYIKNFLKELIIRESLNLEDSRSIQDTIRILNSESQALKDELANKGERAKTFFNFQISDRLDNVIGSFQSEYEFLDEGAFRKVYSLPNQEWVLKLATSVEGARVNRQEIQMSGINQNDDVYHGLGARNIFTKVYDYDRLNDLPWWIMSQKVIPLTDVNNIEILKSVFPTFWNILSSVTNSESDTYLDRAKLKMSKPYNFIDFIASMLISSGIKSKKVRKPEKSDAGWDYLHKKQKPPYYSNLSYRGFTKQMLYNEAFNMFEGELLPIEEIDFGKDVERLSRGLSYVGTTDLHEGNIGIVKSDQPSPNDIVILDFDIHS